MFPRVSETIDANSIVIFPAPPDSTRIQFLTTINSSKDIQSEQSAFQKFLSGEEEILPIIKPYGIATYGSRIYICDSGLGGLEIINLESGKFEYFIPGGVGSLQSPVNLCTDDSGQIYIADGGRKQIVIFDADMNYSSAISMPDEIKPTDVTIYDNKIWVAAVNSHQILVFDINTHEMLLRFPEKEKEDQGYLYQPLSIEVRNEIVYISDFGDPGVKKYTLQGEFINKVGTQGRNFGQFTRPKGIAVDENENLFVVDAAFENVQIFNKEGELLMFFGGGYNGKGAMSLPAGIAIDYTCLQYFEKFVYDEFELQFLIFVSNQFGNNKIGVYGFVNQD